MEILKSKGYLDDSLVIITSDHGDGLGEHGYYSHTFHLYQEEIDVPLIWIDDECKLINTKYATHIDIAPTILDCLNLPMPETWKGKSMMKEYETNRITFHQTIRNNKVIMLIEESEHHMYKLMADYKNSKIVNYRLYDIYSDPTEMINIIDSINKEHLKYLKKELLDFFEIQ